MKINIEKSLIMAATSVAVIFSSCTDHKSDTGSFPLDSFYVKAGDKVYNADIDQNSHIVTIRETLDTRDITEVCYSLGNRDSAIEPDPSSFIGTWQLKQKVDVICGEDTTSYIISIPNMDDASEGHLP